MEKQRIRSLVSICLNGLTFILVLIYLIYSLAKDGEGNLGNSGVGMLKYYTNLSNFLAGIIALLILPFEIKAFINKKEATPLWVLLLKFATVIALLITFLVTACFLGPTNVANGGSYWSLFAKGNIIVHFLVPVIFFISFCFFEVYPEIKFPFSFVGVSTLLLYGTLYVINYYAEIVPGDGIKGQSAYDWYGFLQNSTPLKTTLTIVVMILFAYGLSYLVWLLNRISRKKIWKEGN